jgi:isocitrate dehydrogenase kinase/phosphatase
MSTDRSGSGDVVECGATAIREGFLSFRSEFRAITRQARDRFEQCDWQHVQEDARRRLNLYPEVVRRVVTNVRDMLGNRIADQATWKRMNRSYSRLVQAETDRELAETFYNSITRRIFSTVGVNPDIEFVAPRRDEKIESPDPGCYRRYESDGDTVALVRRIMEDYKFQTRFKDLDNDSALVARQIGAYLSTILGSDRIDAVETLHPVFFRQKAAYVVGRLRVRHQIIPIVLAMLNSDDGVAVDAVLMAEAEVSILFSFTRSHFHVEVDYPRDLVLFLKSIMPLKPIAEIYISLGFTKHGKTELYRGLRRHLDESRERFEFAKGDKGMVMLVFTLPFYDVVFKVIRDRFAYPKDTNRRQVMDRYRLVFRWDRVGRLVEAQEFEHLKFRRELFTSEVLEALTTEAANTVTVNDDHVIIHHVYTERKVTPLNVYLRQVGDDAARRAVIDYGRTVKELAAANVFPGDFLLKNFGVTRHGRVVFYDYDELCLVTDCNFRKMPPARTLEDELDPEPWFAVGEDDIFPEEFERFLGLPAPLSAVFKKHHGELFTADFWQVLKERHLAGEILDFYPYSPTQRLRR